MDVKVDALENKNDDWLSEQKKAESKISPWDLDEGKKIRESHVDNCEAKFIKERHEQAHKAYDKFTKLNKNENQFYPISSKKGILIVCVVVMLGLIYMAIMVEAKEEGSVALALITLMISFIGLSIDRLRKKGKK